MDKLVLILGVTTAFLAGAWFWSRLVERRFFDDAASDTLDAPLRIFMRMRASRWPGWYRGLLVRLSPQELVIGQRMLWSKRRVVIARVVHPDAAPEPRIRKMREFITYRFMNGSVSHITTSGHPEVTLDLEEIDPPTGFRRQMKIETPKPSAYAAFLKR